MSEQLPPRTPLEIQQQQFNDEVAKIAGDLAMWQMRLDLSTNDGSEVLSKIAQNAVGKLNENWQYKNAVFSVIGSWYTRDEDLYIVKEPVAQYATHTGFAAGLNDEGDRIIIGHRFLASQESDQSVYHYDTKSRFAIASPEDISMTYHHDAKIDVQREIQDIKLSIGKSLNAFHAFTSKPAFYTSSLATQRKFVDNILEMPNNYLHNGNVKTTITTQTPLAYTRSGVGPADFNRLEYYQHSQVPFQFSGVLLGIGLLEKDLLDERSINDESDWFDPEVGPSLQAIIEVRESNTGTVPAGTTIFVPFVAHEKMTIHMHMDI